MGYVNPIEYKELCLNGLPLFLDIVKGAFCACLLLQIIFAFLLYFVGYAKKNTSICWLWVLISANTLIISIILFVSSLCETPLQGTPTDPYFWRFQRMVCGRHPTYGLSVAVYELYLFFGIWVVVEHINSIKREAVPATATVMPMPPPQETPSEV
ncbi:unnamed protein product [Orchesella dallaii]|uniref:Uncharacterized protein n=1 Tax=Orchesella dallaii TaxID=48710 RepID=A0ABP1PMN6_9HEXA